MGSVGFIDIISDDEEIPASGKSPEDALEWSSHLLIEDCKGIVDGLDDSVAIQEFLASLVVEKNSVHDAAAGGDDDDDCIVLDGDPHKALVFAKKKKPGEDGPEEDLQIVAEKGEVLLSCLPPLFCLNALRVIYCHHERLNFQLYAYATIVDTSQQLLTGLGPIGIYFSNLAAKPKFT